MVFAFQFFMSSETGTGGMQANCLKLKCFPFNGQQHGIIANQL